MAGGWSAVKPSFAVTGVPNAGSPVAATVTSTCPSNTATCVPRGSARTLKTVPRARTAAAVVARSEEHTSELQSRENLVCRLLLEKKKKKIKKKKIVKKKKKKKKKIREDKKK